MAASDSDIYEMFALRHWRVGLIGNVYNRRKDLVNWAISNVFRDVADYQSKCGKDKPYCIVKVDVTVQVIK